MQSVLGENFSTNSLLKLKIKKQNKTLKDLFLWCQYVTDRFIKAHISHANA